MYAIIQTGGKQYRVTEGQTLKIEKLPVETGKHIDFTEVLMVADGDDRHIGTPFVAKAKVTAEVLGEARGPKIDIIKLKRRKHHIKHMGHRQDYTSVKIASILLGEKKVAAAEKAKKTVKKSAKSAAKKAATKKTTTVKKKTTVKKTATKKATTKKKAAKK